MADMFGWTTQDAKYAKLCLSEMLKAQSESYYEAVSLGYAERDCAEERSFDLLKIAIASIDIQIPKKPIFNSNTFHFCPKCVEMHGVSYDYLVDENYKYCWRCGQALDWSLSENKTHSGGDNHETD